MTVSGVTTPAFVTLSNPTTNTGAVTDAVVTVSSAIPVATGTYTLAQVVLAQFLRAAAHRAAAPLPHPDVRLFQGARQAAGVGQG